MTTYLFYLLSSSLWCVGVFITGNDDRTWVGMFSGWAGKKGWWSKPVITCVSCMASLHTIIISFVGHFLAGISFAEDIGSAIGMLVMLIPAVSALNTILWTLLHKTIIWINNEST